jgi:hypothetical protein
VGLAATELERAGITTVAIQFMREAATGARPPRALFVPFRYGFPADPANEPGRLLRMMEAALPLLQSGRVTRPLLVDWRPSTAE